VAYRFDPGDESWSSVTLANRPRGLSPGPQSRVYVALDQSNQIAMVDTLAINNAGMIALLPGNFPVHAVADFEGHVWSCNQLTGTLSKHDPSDQSEIGSFPVGTSPETYGDLTGYLYRMVTTDAAYYRHRVEAGAGPVKWTSANALLAGPAVGAIALRVRAADTESDLDNAAWSDYVGPTLVEDLPFDLSAMPGLEGTILDVELVLNAEDASEFEFITSIEVQYEVQ